MLEIARDGYFEGPVKKLLSGVRMADKAGVIQPLVRGSDWIFAKSLEKLQQKKNFRRIQWSPSRILYEVATGKGKFTWPEMECIAPAALSLCNLLRIGEAWTAHRSGLGQLVFQGEKSRPGVQDGGPWAERWLRFLEEERRRRGGNAAVAYNFSSPSELEAQWVESVAGTSHRSLRWHGHWRGGATEDLEGHGRPEHGVPSCSSWDGGVRHQWRSHVQHRLTRGNSKVDADSRSRCVKEGNSKLCSESGHPFSGGERGFKEKSVNSGVGRPRMARYWEALTWPERGDERIRQEQELSGLTRKQWTIRLMRERVLQV